MITMFYILLQQHEESKGHFDYLAYLYMKFRKSVIKALTAKQWGQQRGITLLFQIKNSFIPAKFLNKLRISFCKLQIFAHYYKIH